MIFLSVSMFYPKVLGSEIKPDIKREYIPNFGIYLKNLRTRLVGNLIRLYHRISQLTSLRLQEVTGQNMQNEERRKYRLKEL